MSFGAEPASRRTLEFAAWSGSKATMNTMGATKPDGHVARASRANRLNVRPVGKYHSRAHVNRSGSMFDRYPNDSGGWFARHNAALENAD
jgi:hypothetical protein